MILPPPDPAQDVLYGSLLAKLLGIRIVSLALNVRYVVLLRNDVSC